MHVCFDILRIVVHMMDTKLEEEVKTICLTRAELKKKNTHIFISRVSALLHSSGHDHRCLP